MTKMTEDQARKLAKWDRAYIAKQDKKGRWGVWDCKSDHWVEFEVDDGFWAREDQPISTNLQNAIDVLTVKTGVR